MTAVFVIAAGIGGAGGAAVMHCAIYITGVKPLRSSFLLPLSHPGLLTMPATSQCGVFLTLADPKNDCNFWEYPSFADRTSDWKPYHILGATDHNGVELTPALVNAAAAFAEKYWAKQPAEQINYLGKSPTDTDNNTVGRDVWKNSFKEHSKSWKVLKTVEEVLKRHDCDFTAVVDSIDQPESNEVSCYVSESTQSPLTIPYHGSFQP